MRARRKIRSAPRKAAAEPQAGGLIGWLLAQQSAFYRQMSATIRAAKADGSAVWTLLGISFAYGIFHAAGPGHGKAVISSYLVANEETARRGIALSFVSALLQALVAVLIVGICAWLLNATAKTMCSAERVIEIASYALIAAFGARLVWSKGGGFFRALQRRCDGLASRSPPRQHWRMRATRRTLMRITITIMITATATRCRPMPGTIMLTVTTMATITVMPTVMIMATTITTTPTTATRITTMPTTNLRPLLARPGAGRNSPARRLAARARRGARRSASGPVPARSWCWCSRWRRGCSGPGSPPPS